MVIKQYVLCYDGNSPTNNDEKKQQHKETQKIPKKVGFSAIFTDINRRGALLKKKPPFTLPK